MTASAPDGGRMWPPAPRARGLAEELYAAVADRPLVSVHNGLPTRYLAEDLPITDPIGLLVSHDQGVSALLRRHGIDPELSVSGGWRREDASRQAFVLLWQHLAGVWGAPWIQPEDNEAAASAGLPPIRTDADPGAVYDALAVRLAEQPVYPRRVLAAAHLGRFATSDDPADDLHGHTVLAKDPELAGRILPTFSPDRYLDPHRRRWRTDTDLLAEVTGTGTEDLAGFLAALRERRTYFRGCGAVSTEHHTSDVAVARLPEPSAVELYELARSGDLLPDEATALQGHLLWEAGRMAADDGLVMRVFPPAGFDARSGDAVHGDGGVAERIRPLLTDFGAAPGFALQLFTIDAAAYAEEILPLAAQQPSLAAVPPTRFADDPADLRAARVAAVEHEGSGRALGVVDDMSGPFALTARHRLGRRLDAGALAELVVAGRMSAEEAHGELTEAVVGAR